MNETVDRDTLELLRKNAPLKMIAARVKRARTSKGWSHDTLGERCGMYRANLIKLEQAKHRPQLETLERVAEATGREVRWFVDPDLDESPFQAGEKAA